jgi:prepilin-type N-terminal cleavage/methylation domain-containing protein
MSIFEADASSSRTDFQSVNSCVRRAGERSIRRGLTLIEVCLVLVIFAVIAAFCWPAVGNALKSQRLKKSADIVRTEWCKARVKAMSGDCVVLFRYEPNGSRYCIERLLDTALEGSSAANSDSIPNSTGNSANLGDIGSGAEDANAPNNASAVNYPELPKGVVFRECNIQNDSRAQACSSSNTANGTSNSASTTNVGWSSPIYFYPDGTSSSATLQIGNDQNRRIIVTLRGMTGVVKVDEGTTP